MFGWVLLGALTSFCAINALGIALRAELSGRAERAMVALAAFFALVAGPVLALGYTNQLTPTNLALASLALSALVFGLLARGRGARAALTGSLRAGGELLRLPIDGVREAFRSRSFVTLGLLWAAGVLAAAFGLTVLVPFASWDGFYYHEPMIGWALQNRGFRMVDMPLWQPLQSTNGYPRLCESMSLWFVVFTDKTLVELPNTLAGPGVLWCAYALARRYADRVTAMGWAVVMLLVPAVWTQLCHSYIDVQVAFFILLATYFATRPEYRVRDAVLATLGLALLIQSKSSALAWVPPIALVAYGRLLWHHGRHRRRAALATLFGGVAVVAGLAALTLVRNYLAFKNPFWPISYDSAALRLHFPGLATVAYMAPDPPFADFIAKAYGVPIAGVGDVIRRGYGYAVTWVVAPVAIVGVVVALLTAARDLLQKRKGTALNLVLVLFPAAVGLKTTPSLDITRYNLHIVMAMMLAATWVLSGPAWARAREGLVTAALVLSFLPFFWLEGWTWTWVSTQNIAVRWRRPFSSPRQYVDKPVFDLLGRRRSLELHAGDRVVFDQDVDFPGALWNFDFSNRVDYVPFAEPTGYLAKIRALQPTWVAVGGNSARRVLEQSGEFELVGRITPVDGDVVFRRRASAPPGK